MNSIERAYLSGFIKAANGFGFGAMEEALAKAEAAAATPKGPGAKELSRLAKEQQESARMQYSALTHGNQAEQISALDRANASAPSSPQIQLKAKTPEVSKAMVPWTGQPGVSGMPADAHVSQAIKMQQQEAAMRASALGAGNASEQVAGADRHGAELAARMLANPERGLQTIPKPDAGSGVGAGVRLKDFIKKHLNIGPESEGKMNMHPSQLGQMPLGQAALVGGGAGLAADLGGRAAGNIAGSAGQGVQLKNPQVYAYDQAVKQQRNTPIDGLYSKLMNSVQKHPYWWGGGALAGAGLGVANHYMNKHKNEDNDEPGGDPQLT